MASYLDARARHGQWLLRIEDVDRTRTVAGAADQIRRDLERLGLWWDAETPPQSLRTERYRQIIADLLAQDRAFACDCSRSEIRRSGRSGPTGPIYPGTCRQRALRPRATRSIRLKTPDLAIEFRDRWSGPFRQHLARDVGDFVIRRADGYTAYHLAVVVDDQDQGVTDVVRGRDLLDSTPRQIWLQRLLGYATPRYAHVPLVLDDLGRKLSKRTRADPVSAARPVDTLLAAYAFLTQNINDRAPDSVADFWPWAIAQWSAAALGNNESETRHDDGSDDNHALPADRR